MKFIRKILFIISTQIRHCSSDRDLTNAIYDVIWILDNGNPTVNINQYEIMIKTPSQSFFFWNENKWYGWLHLGEINGTKYNGKQPSRSAMFEFKECLIRNGHIKTRSAHQFKTQRTID